MFTLGFFLVLAFFNAHQSAPPPEDREAMQQQAKLRYERDRQAAIAMNEQAGQIRTAADAVALVDGIATFFADSLPPAFATQTLRRRVAQAEFAAISDPAQRIPEQRIADVWNEYARSIGAPEETMVTVAEIHNLRDATHAFSQSLWTRELNQSVWTMPNIYALNSEGKVADACRAIEALRVLHDLDYSIDNLRGARDRVQKGLLVSDELQKRQQSTNASTKTVGRLVAGSTPSHPVLVSELDYRRNHGQDSYNQLIEKLFDELFPAP